MTWLFAHRGGGDAWLRPNSLEAFADATARGALIETDIRVSRDGVVVMVHDVVGLVRSGYTIPRVVVPHLTSARGLRRSGVVSLAEFYAVIAPAGPVSIDLKDVAAWPGAIAAATEAGMIDRMMLVHNDLAVLTEIRAASDTVLLMHEATGDTIDAPGFDHTTYLEELRRIRVDAQNTHVHWWNPTRVRLAREHGIRSGGSLLNDAASLARARDLGLDIVYSDEIAIMNGVFAAPPGTGTVEYEL